MAEPNSKDHSKLAFAIIALICVLTMLADFLYFGSAMTGDISVSALIVFVIPALAILAIIAAGSLWRWIRDIFKLKS
jgi:heme/copper-type cytochrome/quinol oxidase subunit 4